MVMPNAIPNPDGRYMPRAEAPTLSRIVQDAWAWHRDRTVTEADIAEIGAVLATHLETRFPAADMAVLARYDAARPVVRASVSIYCAVQKLWNVSIGVPLPYPVAVPNRGEFIHAGGPRWSETPDRGVSEKYRLEMLAAGEWQKFCDDQDRRERDRAPRETEPFFERVAQLNRGYAEQFKAVDVFVESRRKADGKYPLWRQIEGAFPVIGGYLAERRAAG